MSSSDRFTLKSTKESNKDSLAAQCVGVPDDCQDDSNQTIVTCVVSMWFSLFLDIFWRLNVGLTSGWFRVVRLVPGCFEPKVGGLV